MKAALALLLIVLVAAPAIAEEDVSQELDEVVVTASRVRERLKEAPVTINVVSEKEVEKVKYRNPEEILTRVPGIYTHDFGGESELTSIRVPTHFTNPYTVVLVDGVPVNSYGEGSSGQLGEFNSDNIARIEIVKGPASALYGSNAIGGIINVITKTPSATPQARLWAEIGEDDHWRNGFSAGGSGEKASFNGGFQFIDSEGWREHTDLNKKAGNIKMQILPGEQSILSFRVDYLDLYNETGNTLNKTDFIADWQQSYHTFTYSKLVKWSPSLTFNYYMDKGEFKAVLAMRDIDHEVLPAYGIRQRAFGPFPRPYDGSFSLIDGRDIDLQLLYSRQLPFFNSKLVAGIDTEYGNTDTDKFNITANRDAALNKFTSYTLGALDESLDVTTQVAAPYLQLQAPVGEKMRITAGGRYDSTKYDVDDKLFQGQGGDENFSKFTPKAGITYDVTPSLNSYFNYSQGFVVPTTSQLLTSSGANRNLDAEEATNYEVGLRGDFFERKMLVDLALYYMEIEEKIVTDANRNYLNAGETSHRGVETTITLSPIEYARLTLGYTYARNKYETYNSTGIDYGGNYQPRSPKQHLNARLCVMPFTGFEAELEMDAISSQYADDANLFDYSRPTLLNLRASYDRKDWSFWLHIKNLTDQKYATYVSYSSTDGVTYYSGRPRAFFAGVAYKWSI